MMADPPLPRVFAIVPAAGRSRRMGAAKQLLDVGGRPMLLAMVEPLAAAQVAGVALVTHHAIAERIDVAHVPGVFLVSNEDESSEMIDSVRLGLRAWLAREHVTEQDGLLVCPGDQPGISTSDFDACVAAFRRDPERIVVGEHAGRRGHPIVFPAALAPFVESSACNAGLRAMPQALPDRVVGVACESLGVGRDVDTMRDYEDIG